MTHQSTDALRYGLMCNLIETLWAEREEKEYYNIDLNHLIPFTSPEARRIASFIHDVYDMTREELLENYFSADKD